MGREGSIGNMTSKCCSVSWLPFNTVTGMRSPRHALSRELSWWELERDWEKQEPKSWALLALGRACQGEKTGGPGMGAAPLPWIAAPSHTQVCTLPSPPPQGPAG